MNQWNNKLNENTSRFKKEFGRLEMEVLNWKPDKGTWSIGENIQHLKQVNESYFPIFEELKTGELSLPLVSKFGFMVSFFGNLILKSVNPDRKKKMKTFPLWNPASSGISSEIIDEFESSQEILKDHISDLSGKIDKRMVIYSPANRNIVYRLETALDIIVSHQMRHFNQAKEVLESYRDKHSG